MHIFGEMIQFIINLTLLFNLPSEQGKVDAPGGELAVIRIHFSPSASFSEAPLVLAGAWVPTNRPKVKVFS